MDKMLNKLCLQRPKSGQNTAWGVSWNNGMSESIEKKRKQTIAPEIICMLVCTFIHKGQTRSKVDQFASWHSDVGHYIELGQINPRGKCNPLFFRKCIFGKISHREFSACQLAFLRITLRGNYNPCSKNCIFDGSLQFR